MSEKFRSIKAFKAFEERALSDRGGAVTAEPTEAVSPVRILAVVKKHPQGVSRRKLAAETAAPVPLIDEALLHLLKEDLVRVEAGPTPDDDLILP